MESVVVLGLGKIGLPLALQIAKNNYDVIGVDINPKVIEIVNKGIAPFPNENQLEEYLKESLEQGNFHATLDLDSSVKKSDYIIFAIPLKTKDDNSVDFSAYDELVRRVSLNAKKGSSIIFETTLPIGTTKNRFSTLIEKYTKFKIGENIYVAYSPERVSSGRVFEDLGKYPKVVGGVDILSGEKVKSFYESILDFQIRYDLPRENGVWLLKNSEHAEAVKLFETTYRDVNIALANQFAWYCHHNGIDFFEVRKTANSQPYSNIHEPGISVGGHCIPMYPHFYLQENPSDDLVRIARQINKEMPSKIVNFIESRFKSLINFNVLILGISYRENVKETTLSGAFDLNVLLLQKGANVTFYDPLFSQEEIEEMGLKYASNPNDAHIVILHTGHSVYHEWNFSSEFRNLKMIFDGRNYLQITLENKKFMVLGNC